MKRRRKDRTRRNCALSSPELLESRKLFSATDIAEPVTEIGRVLGSGQDYLIATDQVEQIYVHGREGSKAISFTNGTNLSVNLPGGMKVVGASSDAQVKRLLLKRGELSHSLELSDDWSTDFFTGLSNRENPLLTRDLGIPFVPCGTGSFFAEELPLVVDEAIASIGGVLTIEGNNVIKTFSLAKEQAQFLTVNLYPGSYRATLEVPQLRVSSPVSFFVDPGGNCIIDQENVDANIIRFTSSEESSHEFHYIWEGDFESPTGYEYSQHVNQPTEVKFLGESIEQPNSTAVEQLIDEYGVYLSKDGQPWSSAVASRLLKTLEQIPGATEKLGEQSLWVLTDEHLPDDISFIQDAGSTRVTISTHAFTNATPRLAEVDGEVGTWRSSRLQHALVQWVTNNGENFAATENILVERYGVRVTIPDYERVTVLSEPAENYQQFSGNELLTIINMFEEMPEGMHKIDSLKYLLRRQGGHLHPLYPDAPAVAWISHGYIEFMDAAFSSPSHLGLDPNHIERLMIHEKAHFVWYSMMPPSLRQEWNDVGEWYKGEDGEWYTNQTTQFVSAYAHSEEPGEDFAESFSYYIINPDKLKSHAPLKYEFLKTRVMQGARYLSIIREDLTFEVLNLSPDYIYPGKIGRVEVTVDGDPEEDKVIDISVELDERAGEYANASRIFMRLHSEKGTYRDIHLHRTDLEGFKFRKRFTLSKHAASGSWAPDQIRVADRTGNYRYQDKGTFGWKLDINNPLEDLTAPIIDKDSVEIRELDASESQNGQRQLEVSYLFSDDNLGIRSVYTRLHTPTGVNWDTYGRYTSLGRSEDGDYQFEAKHYWNIKEFHPVGDYRIGHITVTDVAGNNPWHNINGVSEYVVTSNPDTVVPELDINNISIVAAPTNPSSPNGETLVTLTYQVRDNNSGLDTVYLRLRDPQGKKHFFYHYHNNFYTEEFRGDATEWSTYTFTTLLPEGSAAGTWGLANMTLQDKAMNRINHSFTEIVRFSV